MSITFRDYGPYQVYQTYVNNSEDLLQESDFRITKFNQNELNITLLYQGLNIDILTTGQYEYGRVTNTPATLLDLNVLIAQGLITGVTESQLFSINGEYAGLLRANPALSFQEFDDLLDATNLAALRRILSGNDEYITSSTADDSNAYYLYGGNDRFYQNHPVLEFADVFYGGSGIDTAVFTGRASNFTVVASDRVWDNMAELGNLSGYVVTDSTARVNTLQIHEVERLQFSDTMVALDIAPNQTAGKVYMLYQATFNRTPDTEGLGYWIKQVDNGANITTDVAAFFVTSPEFVAKYGANPSVASYVDNLYLNVLGRPGEAGGVAYWNQELSAGRITRAAVLEAFATLPEGAALVADAIANGIQYQEWLGQGSNFYPQGGKQGKITFIVFLDPDLKAA